MKLNKNLLLFIFPILVLFSGNVFAAPTEDTISSTAIKACDCKNGECVQDKNTLTYVCRCRSGFEGADCSNNIDDCAKINVTAVCGHAGVCVDQINGYFCQCDDEYIGYDCFKNKIPSPCSLKNLKNDRIYFPFPSPLQNKFIQCLPLVTCQNEEDEDCAVGDLVVKTCPNNLNWHQDLLRCEYGVPEIAKPCASDPCTNGATCEISKENMNDYVCHCPPGFTGDKCEMQIDYCAEKPCQNGGRCVNEVGGYTCHCANNIVDYCCCTTDVNPCNDRQLSPLEMMKPNEDFFPHHFYLNMFYHCNNHVGFVGLCPDDLIWDQKHRRCTYQLA